MIKKLVVSIVLAMLLRSTTFSYDVHFGGVSLYNGYPRTPDSIRVNTKYYPSGTTGTHLFTPASYVLDQVVSVATGQDISVTQNYKIYFTTATPPDSTFAFDTKLLRLDSLNYTSGYWAYLADVADSSGQAKWNYVTREPTSKTGYGLSTAERAALSSQIKDSLEAKASLLWTLSFFWGTQSKATVAYYPNNGASPKDSVVVSDSLGVPRMRVKFHHSNNSNVLDSTTTKVY